MGIVAGELNGSRAVEIKIASACCTSFYLVIMTIVAEGDNNPYNPIPKEWEDGQSSWEEFGHDNNPDICGLPLLSVAEWENGRYWERNKPVLVSGVTDGWAALSNWKKQEMLHRYPNAEATMGDAKIVGETGPDNAGKNLSPTTLYDFITKYMYDPTKYFFDRKIAIPKPMLDDCKPLPMPTSAFFQSSQDMGEKRRSISIRSKSDPRLRWKDHLAISIGSDLQGLTFHNHPEAWNIVIFGKKRWILWDHARWKDNTTLQDCTTRDWANNYLHVTGAEWIRRLYPDVARQYEIRNHGHDCIQHAGQMMFIPHKWMHMVVNIGDTVSVVSEVGLGMGEGKKPEDFLYDPNYAARNEEFWLQFARGSFFCSLVIMVFSLVRLIRPSWFQSHQGNNICTLHPKRHSKLG
jgi:hypothetical protein